MEKNKIILIEDKKVVNFLPKHEGVGALVDLSTLKRILSYLPEGALVDTKERFIARIEESSTMKAYTEVLADELAFHTTCNQISTFDLASLEEAELLVD